MSSTALSLRRVALRRLLEQNTRGELASPASGARGFVDAKRRRHAGVYAHLAGKVPRHRLRHAFRMFPPGSIKREISGTLRAAAPSRAELGIAVHAQVHHELHCRAHPTPIRADRPLAGAADGGARGPLTTRRCTRCGASAAARRRVAQMVEGARRFAAKHALVPLLAEQVILSDRHMLGTRFDSLMFYRDEATGDERVVLVDWKTGGAGLLHPDAQGVYSDTVYLNAAQVIVEAAILRRAHGVLVDEAYVVYLQSNTGVKSTEPAYHAQHITWPVLSRAGEFYDAVIP